MLERHVHPDEMPLPALDGHPRPVRRTGPSSTTTATAPTRAPSAVSATNCRTPPAPSAAFAVRSRQYVSGRTAATS
ncbi:hypothetical protein SHIRM173S_12444 [Streptomyces hirsutus]